MYIGDGHSQGWQDRLLQRRLLQSGCRREWRIILVAANGAGTPNCPAICGQWGFYSGYGKFSGIAGGGTWKAATNFSDGTGMGTWDGSYEMK